MFDAVSDRVVDVAIGQIKGYFRPSDAERAAAWELLVELSTRTTTAPLDPDEGSIREALLNPIDDDPLPELLKPGMKLTIAFDDLSLPLPSMRKPDIRQRIIEQVLDMAAEAGVDDVHLIAALALGSLPVLLNAFGVNLGCGA